MTNTKKISAEDYLRTLPESAANTVDLRTPAERGEEHIVGTRHLPLGAFSGAKLEALFTHSDDSPIYLLCQSGRRAEMALQQAQGDTRLHIIEGGLNALKQCGCPTRLGEGNAISLERQVRITAGLLVLTGVVLGALLNPMFYALSGFVGAGLTFAGITDTCAMGMLLARMPWNTRTEN